MFRRFPHLSSSSTKKLREIDPWPITPSVSSCSSSSSRQKFKRLQHDLQSNRCHRQRQQQSNHELVIIVDAPSILYRRAFSYLNERSSLSTLSSSSSSSSSPKAKSSSSKTEGFEVDPTKWLQSSIAHSLKFLHSVIPIGDGDETYQPDLLSAELVGEGIKCGRIKYSGGLMKRGPKELAYLAKMKGKIPPLVLQEDFSSLSSPTTPTPTTPTTAPPIQQEKSSPPSSSLLKRKIFFCFDHGSENVRNTRSKIVSEYKAHRPKRCGRMISFVNYGAALIRQLAASKRMIHGVFPVEMKQVDVSSSLRGEQISSPSSPSSSAFRFEKLLDKIEEMTPTQQMKHISRFITRQDPFLKSLFDATTKSSPFSLPASKKIQGEADDIVFTLVKYYSELNTRNCRKHYSSSVSSSSSTFSSSSGCSDPPPPPNYSTLIVSSDKDLLQLLEYPNTYFFHVGNNEFVTRNGACRKYSVESPKQIADILTLMGDHADNVQGLPGTGAKRASQIVKQFGSVENLVEQVVNNNNNNNNSKKKQKQNDDDDGNAAKPTVIILDSENDHSKHNSNNSHNRSHHPDKKNRKKSATTQKRTKPNGYEETLVRNVQRRGDQLLAIKKHVISLQELPWVRTSVEKDDHHGVVTKGKNLTPTKKKMQAKEPQTKEKRFSPAADFSKIPDEMYRSGAHCFALVSEKGGEAVSFNPLTSSRKVSEAFWKLVRVYYTKNFGNCNENNEHVHGCGLKSKEKMKSRFGTTNKQTNQRKK